MPAKHADSKQQHLLKAVQAARRHAGGTGTAVEEFTRQLYRAVSAEDLLDRSAEDLGGSAAALWDLMQKRNPGELSLRIYNPAGKQDGWNSTHTVVEMVNDDMPFLVDTITMALNRHGLGIHLTVHPIMRVTRDKRGKLTELLPADQTSDHALVESVMRVEFDREVRADKLKELGAYVRKAMGDVRAAVKDWAVMRKKCADVIAGLQTSPPPLAMADVAEGKRFLEWLVDNHFTFLGYREYDLVNEKNEDVLKPVAGSGLGILREAPGEKAKVSKSFMVLPKDVRATARAKELLIVTKANSIATVHRPSYMDYIGVKRFNSKGEVIGEQRFLGLFTSSAYAARPEEIPLLQHKVEQVMLRSKLPPKSHGGKALLHILETFPRDELFQSSTEELYEIALGVLQLQERQRVRVFMRRDGFGRYFSCLVYVPRDRYNTQVRLRIEEILKRALHGVSAEAQTQVSESVLARVHVIVRVTPWQFPAVDLRAIEHDIADAVRSWTDELKDVLIQRLGEGTAVRLWHRFGEYMPEAYRADTKPKAAAFDLTKMDELKDDQSIALSLYHPKHAPAGVLRFKVFRREQPIPISDALPMLENMGLKVISEHPYEVDLADGSIVWIQDFEMVHHETDLKLEDVCAPFQDAFGRVFKGDAENDGFNRLVLAACLTWRQVALLRATCKYLLQAGLPFSQAYMEQTLVSNAPVAQILVRMFESRHDPKLKEQEREARYGAAKEALKTALENIKSLDEDRILRAFRNVLKAALRTNYFQQQPGQPAANGALKHWISFKLDPAKIPELPLPKPMFEIWVYSPRVEGVHLRFGKVARGGLRWSDRREDFRTEVLGLVKAQNVKNTVIVPVGSKGGFFVKRPPAGGEREAMMKEGVSCYQTFLRGLLDVTDNLNGAKVVPPKDVVRLDPDDPYLVVAADKGTATFSDIANGISAEYGFWLGDAFASGGSAGYDHKKMGITAKGGWESVKRHFLELGKNIQREDFTVVGVGDMSGDVFGNGMLLSEHIKLVAAFDHRHIFLDPNPDAAASFKERNRMFALARSSWADYDQKLISKGGGVFPRGAKSIAVSAEAARALGIQAGNLAPAELMRAILKAPVDLLWNGGIGTYVKAARETNAEVGDRANDAIRINGGELRCKVIGEGGNLGCTQLGRVEFALAGGRINTDFIDNSAGVDCSDHEVNIKILLGLAQTEKRLTDAKRNQLLARMTDEVGALVLRDNYMHAFAISVAEAQAPGRISEHAHLIRVLEREGKLNRALEFLPTDDEFRDRRKQGKGLTRPEIAILFAYAKMDVLDEIIASDVPEDPYLAQELIAYFPVPLQRECGDLMKKHRLRREIIATAITNSMVNRMGSTFAMRMTEESGLSAAEVARAYTAAREAFDMPALWTEIEALDGKVAAKAQVEMMVQLGRTLRLATHWFLDRPEIARDIAAAVDVYRPALTAVAAVQPGLLGAEDRDAFDAAFKSYRDAGVPEALARRVAGISALYAGLDIADIARAGKLDVKAVTEAYYGVDGKLGISWIRTQIERLPVDGHWQAIARGSLRDNLYGHQRRITAAALGGQVRGAAAGALAKWFEQREQRIQHLGRVISDMRGLGSLDFATASVALQEISKLA